MHGACVWICGLPGSGRSTIATLVARDLARRGIPVELLDDAEAHDALVLNLYRAEPPAESDLLRLAYVAKLLTRHGVVAIVAADSGKDATREIIADDFEHFVTVYVDTPVELCAARAEATEPDAAPFEAPLAPDLRVVTHDRAPTASAAQVVSYLEGAGLIPTGFVS